MRELMQKIYRTELSLLVVSLIVITPCTAVAMEDHDWTNPHYQADIRSSRILWEAKLFYADIHDHNYQAAKKYLRRIQDNLHHIKKLYKYGF